MLVQLRLQTELSSEDYINQKEWLNARLDACPLHPGESCGFRKVGYYDRVKPVGLRVGYWHCPRGHRAFSLLPDFAAARVSSGLVEIEESVRQFEDLCGPDTTFERAAAAVRPDVERASAVRWVRRRRRWVRAALAIAIGLLPLVLAGCEPSLCSVRAALNADYALVRLRQCIGSHLAQMPSPVGFGPLSKSRPIRRRSTPHKAGPDLSPSTQ